MVQSILRQGTTGGVTLADLPHNMIRRNVLPIRRASERLVGTAVTGSAYLARYGKVRHGSERLGTVRHGIAKIGTVW